MVIGADLDALVLLDDRARAIEWRGPEGVEGTAGGVGLRGQGVEFSGGVERRIRQPGDVWVVLRNDAAGRRTGSGVARGIPHYSCEYSLAIKCPRKPWGAGVHRLNRTEYNNAIREPVRARRRCHVIAARR